MPNKSTENQWGGRKALKVVAWSLAGALLLLVTYLGLLFYPGCLFTHTFKYANFTVHSDQDIGMGVEGILRNVDVALKTSTIYDPALEHDIFFGHGNAVFGAIQRSRAKLVALAIGIPPALTYNASWPPYFSDI